MPLVEVTLWDRQATEETVPKIIERVTDAVAESSGAARETVLVIVRSVPPQHTGVAGKPGA